MQTEPRLLESINLLQVYTNSRSIPYHSHPKQDRHGALFQIVVINNDIP